MKRFMTTWEITAYTTQNDNIRNNSSKDQLGGPLTWTFWERFPIDQLEVAQTSRKSFLIMVLFAGNHVIL